MKLKKEYIVLALVIIALAAYLGFRKTDRTHYRLPAIGEALQADMTKVEITRNGKTTALAKKDGRWVIEAGEFPVDPQKISDMLAAMEKLSLSARISESKNYERYELGDEQKIGVKVWAVNAVKREMEIGSTASTFRHTHVRLAGDDIVYQAQGNLRAKFDVTEDGLRDKTVIAFDMESVVKLTIRKDGKTVVVSRKEGAPQAGEKEKEKKALPSGGAATEKAEPIWEDGAGKRADAADIRRVLTAISGLKCQEFIKGLKKEDLRQPIIEIVINDKTEHRLVVFAKTDKAAKSHPAFSSGSDYPFLLADHQLPDLGTFLKS